MFCVLVKYQDLNMLLVLIKMFRAWFLFLSVEENSTISTTKHLLHVREQMESLVSQMVFRDFAVMDSHFNCSPTEIWAVPQGGKSRHCMQLPSTVRSGGMGRLWRWSRKGEPLDVAKGDGWRLEEEEKRTSLKWCISMKSIWGSGNEAMQASRSSLWCQWHLGVVAFTQTRVLLSRTAVAFLANCTCIFQSVGRDHYFKAQQ